MTAVVIRPVRVNGEWRWQCDLCRHTSGGVYPDAALAATQGARAHKCTHPLAPRGVIARPGHRR